MAETPDTGLAQDMNPQMGGGPPPFMPGQISPMMTGAPPQSGGVLPPSNPIDATQQQGGLSPELQAAITQGAQVGAQGLQTRESAAMGPQMGGMLPSLIQKQQEQSGDLSWHPHMVHGQGAGGFFHNLGQALIALGLSTKIGGAVENVMYSKPRQEYAGRAKEISELQKQQELTQQPEGALSNALYHGANVQINQEKTDIARKRMEAYAKDIESKATDRLVKETQGFERLTLAQQKQKLMEWYDREKIDAERRGQDLGVERTEINATTGRSIAAAITGNSYIKEHPLLYGITQAIPELKQWLPDMQAPAGAATETTKPGQPIPQSKAGGPSKPRASQAAPAGGGAAPARPANVPPNYIYKKNGPKGEGWYKPTAASPGGLGL